MAANTAQDELITLLGRIAQKDRNAFRKLYDQMAGRMFGICNKLAGQPELAEEALQDAFVRIWHHASEYHSERGTPLTWMLTIARYRTLDLMRARKVRRTAGPDMLETIADETANPLDASLQADNAAALNGCMEELSASQRDSILLSYYRGFTHDDLAITLDSPIGTVKSWIRRGLLVLKRCLER